MSVAEVSIQIKAVFDAKKVLEDDWRIIHAPNEEAQSPRAVSKQMALGMLPGVADLLVISPIGKLHAMEFKSETGTLDENQRNFQLWCIRSNIPHSVVRSVDEAMKVFRHWGCIRELAAHDARS